MRQISVFLGIIIATVLVAGCGDFYAKSEELATGRPISVFQDTAKRGGLFLNRELVKKQAKELYAEGFRRADNYSSYEEEKFFDGLLESLWSEYKRAAGSDERACATVADRVLQRTYAFPYTAAGKAYDNCLFDKGWEPSTQDELDKIALVALEQEHRKAQRYSSAAKPPNETGVAERVFENTWRSVVVISAGERQGSGVIVRPNVVATNCHVVDGGRIAVYKTGDRRALTDSAYSATITKRDTARDFCMLNVNGLWGVPANIRAYDTLKVGEDVYALGAPKGLDLSLSTGVISQLRQDGNERFVQTDAAISPGSSGGGLFDSDGNLVGITTEKLVDEEVEGIGFAIPADLVLGN